MAHKKGQPPMRHLIIEEKKEVWFVGSFALAMGLKSIMAKYFPGYKGCLASKEHFDKLKETNGSN